MAITVAAVIPLYNGAKYIEEAIRSIFTQTEPVDEVIVVNDGSKDNGPEIVNSLSASYPITFLHQVNSGQSSARNAAIRHTPCTHIAFLDQDDVWYVDHIDVLKRQFLNAEVHNLALAYGNLDQIDKDGRMVVHCCLDSIPTPQPKKSLKEHLQHDLFIVPSASMVLKEAIERVGMFDERLSGYEDDDLFLRLYSATYGSAYINKSVTKWRLYSSSTSFSKRMATSRMIYFKKQLELFPDDPVFEISWSRDVIGPRFMLLAHNDFVKATRSHDLANIERAWADVEAIAPVMKTGISRRVRRFSPLIRLLYQNRLYRRARRLAEYAVS
jgi:glycosyltransferase involved in cell wall biosynthesis